MRKKFLDTIKEKLVEIEKDNEGHDQCTQCFVTYKEKEVFGKFLFDNKTSGCFWPKGLPLEIDQKAVLIDQSNCEIKIIITAAHERHNRFEILTGSL